MFSKVVRQRSVKKRLYVGTGGTSQSQCLLKQGRHDSVTHTLSRPVVMLLFSGHHQTRRPLD